MERRAKAKSLLFGRGHQDRHGVGLSDPGRCYCTRRSYSFRGAIGCKGTEEDTIDVDDYQLVALNTEWKSGCWDKGKIVMLTCTESQVMKGGVDDTNTEKGGKGEGSSEEDTDEGGTRDVQESRSLQSTPSLMTHKAEIITDGTNIVLQVTSMSKEARAIAKRTRITKSG